MKRALIAVALAACSPVMPEGDSCAPGGHVHRDPAGDWCHCDRGFRATADGLACEVDPTFRDTLELGDSDERACWHAANGPFETVSTGGAVNAFLVFFTVELTRRDDGRFEGEVTYRPGASGAHAFSLDSGGPLKIVESLEGTASDVKILTTRASDACDGVKQQWGAVLEARATYVLHVGPTNAPTAKLLIDWLD
ncbi:MAG: hypothetical protein DI536_09735 [Archangium gephyra]|uniref:Uncharacterized protein n=1 Tax=Archangium gephyra TaxID=48 RepID=A0A2W5TR76_9BACT|nr:MAG: hypothetical protein DI536_09735 [Archangium gephyra]